MMNKLFTTTFVFILCFLVAASVNAQEESIELCGQVLYKGIDNQKLYVDMDMCQADVNDTFWVEDSYQRNFPLIVSERNRFYYVLESRSIHLDLSSMVAIGDSIYRNPHPIRLAIDEHYTWESDHELMSDYIDLLKKYRKLSQDMVRVWSLVSQLKKDGEYSNRIGLRNSQADDRSIIMSK